MTQTDRTRTALAVLGQPDRTFAYHMGPLAIPYLSLSFREMDLIDAIPTLEDPEDDTPEFRTRKRRAECEAAFELLSRRLGAKGPGSVEEVAQVLNPADFYGWVNDLIGGGKGEPVGEADSP
ncbi:hypothetical protein [Deinococcus sp. NW-56]|uniref:hypothetical protein n=1 Tax=Deinococcus sp. NW-56 TaxID=2080419 RepID=UPI000CF45E52|nr:hypothetical protein [Deinococcus sp. NW-56]